MYDTVYTWYTFCPIPSDDLPYSAELRKIADKLARKHPRELYHWYKRLGTTNAMAAAFAVILYLRKNKKLKATDRESRPAPIVHGQDAAFLAERLRFNRAEIDGLPFTLKFDLLRSQYNQHLLVRNHPLVSDHEFWRILIRVAKTWRKDDGQMSLFPKT